MYIIIVGAGQIGSEVINLATSGRHEIVVIEKDETIAERTADEYDCLILNADATVAETLEEAGAERADAVISTTDDDATNIMVMLLAQEFEIPSLVSVVHNREHMNLFRRIGVNIIQNPQRLIAEYLYRAVQRPSIKDFMHLGGGAEVFEITVTDSAPIAGKTIEVADGEGLLTDDVLLVAIERGDDVLTPRGQTTVKSGDLVTVFSQRGFAQDVLQVFTGQKSPAQ